MLISNLELIEIIFIYGRIQFSDFSQAKSQDKFYFIIACNNIFKCFYRNQGSLNLCNKNLIKIPFDNLKYRRKL